MKTDIEVTECWITAIVDVVRVGIDYAGCMESTKAG